MFVDFRRLVSSAASFFFLAALYKFICSAISVWLFRCFDPKSCARVSDPEVRLLLLLLLLLPTGERHGTFRLPFSCVERKKASSSSSL